MKWNATFKLQSMQRKRIRFECQAMAESIFFTFGGLMHLPPNTEHSSVQLITCICYNKVLSCEVDHINSYGEPKHAKKNDQKRKKKLPRKIITIEISVDVLCDCRSIFSKTVNIIVRCGSVDRSVVFALLLVAPIRHR